MAIQESARKDDVLYSTVVQLGEMLRGGRITCRDLTLSYIERIKQVDPKLNAFITVTEGLAVQQAERADKELQGGSYLGPLHGIPYGAMANSWTMDKIGPMARSAEDCRLVLEAINGTDPQDPT